MPDWKQLLSLLPAAGAGLSGSGGAGLGAFMEGYQRTLAMLDQQARQREGLDLDREQLGMQRERYEAEDADRAAKGQRADIGSLMDLLPELAGQVSDAPAVTAAPPSGGGFAMTPPLGALMPTPEGVDPAGVVRRQVGTFAAGAGMRPEAAEAVAPMAGMFVSRAQAAAANEWRAAVKVALDRAEKRSGATSDDLTAAGTVLDVRNPKTDQVVRVPYAEALEIAGMPALRAGPKAESKDTRSLEQQLNEADRAGDTTEANRLRRLIREMTVMRQPPERAAQGDPADERERATKRRAVVGSTSRTLDALDELLTQDGTLTPSAAAAVGLKRISPALFVPGSAAYDGNVAIDRLRARLVTDLMAELKSQSRTGATGFGQLNIQELKLIQDAAAKLNPRQSPESFTAELVKIRDRLILILQEPGPAPASPNGQPKKVGRFEIVEIR